MLDVKTESQLYNEDLDFLEAHYDELLEKYPEQWAQIHHLIDDAVEFRS